MKRSISRPVLALALLALGACAGHTPKVAVAPPSEDYRQRHPIHIGEGVEATFVPVARGSAILSRQEETDVAAFLSAAATTATSPVTISVPKGGANALAAASAGKHLADLAYRAGFARHRVVVDHYESSGTGTTPPIRIAYWRIKASVAGCEHWTSPVDTDPDNNGVADLGCATQGNLAAMITDPQDLVTMHADTPADGVRRATVMSTYEKGGDTGTTYTTTKNSTTGSNE